MDGRASSPPCNIKSPSQIRMGFLVLILNTIDFYDNIYYITLSANNNKKYL
jgi:hypothetical protein